VSGSVDKNVSEYCMRRFSKRDAGHLIGSRMAGLRSRDVDIFSIPRIIGPGAEVNRFNGKRSFKAFDFTYRFGAFSPIPMWKDGGLRAAPRRSRRANRRYVRFADSPDNHISYSSCYRLRFAPTRGCDYIIICYLPTVA
jgi:hypothetical protein